MWLRKVRGSWSLNFRSPPSHQVCHRSQSMHWSALAGDTDCTHMLTATDGPAASGSTGERTRKGAPLATASKGRHAAPPLAPLVGTISQGARTQSGRKGTRESQGRLGAGRGWLIRARQPRCSLGVAGTSGTRG